MEILAGFLILILLLVGFGFFTAKRIIIKQRELELKLKQPIEQGSLSITLNKLVFYRDLSYNDGFHIDACHSAKLEHILLYASFRVQGEPSPDWDWHSSFSMELVEENGMSYPGILLNKRELINQKNFKNPQRVQLVAECPEKLAISFKSLLVRFKIRGQIYNYKLK